MITNKHIKIVYKTLFGVLGLSSILLEIVTLTQRGVFDAANFFSYFTVLSNIFAAVVLMIGALYLFRSEAPSYKMNLLRGAATFYMLLTGVVFAVLLSGYDPRTLTAVPWDNTVLHYIMPVVMIIDWIIDPPMRTVRFKHALLWLVFPVAYVLYSLIRGTIVNGYPYPFLDPEIGGYGSILVTCLGITLFGLFGVRFLVKAQYIHKVFK